jgi:signal transduction histidine kinase
VIFDVTERRELMAQRARIIAAQDETRCQIVRDLHDGAQQRLVSVALALRAVKSRVLTDAHQHGAPRPGSVRIPRRGSMSLTRLEAERESLWHKLRSIRADAILSHGRPTEARSRVKQHERSATALREPRIDR